MGGVEVEIQPNPIVITHYDNVLGFASFDLLYGKVCGED
jgi:hypothetical protein